MNAVRTAVLLGGTSALVLAVGSLFGPGGLLVGAAAALAVSGWAWLRSDALALRAMRARPVSEFEAPALHRVVRELSQAARMPMPRVCISPTETPSAFVTGRDPRHAAVCVTTGLLRLLDARELRAVLAHELAHVRHRDVLVASVAGALASTIGVLATLAVVPALVDDDEDRPHPLAALVAALLAPVAAGLVLVAVSRSREFRADERGAALTGDPLALASALRTLQRGVELAPLPPEPRLVAQSHMMITSPFRSDGRAARLPGTHPPLEERVRRLEEMARRC